MMWKMVISDSVTSDEVCCYLVLLVLLIKAVFTVNVNRLKSIKMFGCLYIVKNITHILYHKLYN